jgi:hypothetical protein
MMFNIKIAIILLISFSLFLKIKNNYYINLYNFIQYYIIIYKSIFFIYI